MDCHSFVTCVWCLVRCCKCDDSSVNLWVLYLTLQLVDASIHDAYLRRSIRENEHQSEKAFHYRTPDCEYWLELVDSPPCKMICPLCAAVNCLSCKAIHLEESCDEYQRRGKRDLERLKTDREIQVDQLIAINIQIFEFFYYKPDVTCTLNYIFLYFMTLTLHYT